MEKFQSWDPILNKSDPLLTRQRGDCEPIVRIFLKSPGTAPF
jgi:hypothetical protein